MPALLRTLLHSLSHAELLQCTSQLLEQLPEKQLAVWVGEWHFARRAASTTPEQMMLELKEFEALSLQGKFYSAATPAPRADPPETQFWFAEMSRWLDYGSRLGLDGGHPLALNMLEICIRLLDEIGEKAIVSAHEAGPWMLHTHYNYREVYRQLTRNTG